jgi:tetratricopeptide (TPR) repeat protein
VESGGNAYHPWRGVLRVLIRYVESADREVLQQASPVLAAILPELWGRSYLEGVTPPAELDPEAAQKRLNSAILRVLRAAARLRPTLIVIENAQWADEATLDLLGVLSRTPGPAGLQVCVTYRDDEAQPDHPLVTMDEARVMRIPVRSLSPATTADLVRLMLGLEALPPLLRERVQQTTGGNAFFVQELIRSLAADGDVLQRTVDGWRVDEAALRSAYLPDSIHQVVWRRLEHLSPEAQAVLCKAAVVGDVFWEGVLAELVAGGQEQMQFALREGVEQALIVEREASVFAGEREYMFVKPVVRQVSYERIPPAALPDDHGRAAAWLIARSDEQAGEHFGLIGGHLERAGQKARAIHYLQRAGERAAAQFANAQAIAYFTRALDLLSEAEDAGATPGAVHTERYALLLAREKVYDLQGHREAQAQELAALEQLAESIGDHRRRARVALRRADYAEAIGDYPATVGAAQLAIALAQAVGDVEGEAEGFLHWGEALWLQGDGDAARSRLEKVLSLATQFPTIESRGLTILGNVYYNQGDYIAARRCYDRALRLSREIGYRQMESSALNNLGNVSSDLGDYAGAIAYYRQALHGYREIGFRRWEGGVAANLGVVAHELGQYDDARLHYEQSLLICRDIGDRDGECMALTNLGRLCHQLGDHEAAQACIRKALDLAQDLGSNSQVAYVLTNRGHVLHGMGKLEEAAEAYKQAFTRWGEMGHAGLAMESLAGLARVLLERGERTEALACVGEILEHTKAGAFEGAEEPFRIYLTCYQVLRANRDPRAGDVLRTAQTLLQERAVRIGDAQLQRSFLENVAVHRELMDKSAGSE